MDRGCANRGGATGVRSGVQVCIEQTPAHGAKPTSRLGAHRRGGVSWNTACLCNQHERRQHNCQHVWPRKPQWSLPKEMRRHLIGISPTCSWHLVSV